MSTHDPQNRRKNELRADVDGSSIKTQSVSAISESELKKNAKPGLQDPNQKTSEYGQLQEPTRMTPGQEMNEEVVIASSRIHDINHPPHPTGKGYRADSTHMHSPISVRSQERNRARLIITYLKTRYTHYLEPGITTIGRGAQNQLQLNDPKISREHARIEVQLNGYRILDSGGDNGLRVNGKKTRATELFDTDEIRLGDTTLIFETVGWSRKRQNLAFDSGFSGWAEILSQLSPKDRIRLGIYSISLSFLTAGFIFLLMSFLSQSKPLSDEQHALNYRHQAEKRALDGDLSGALRSMDKVTFIKGSLTTSDQRRRAKWVKRIDEREIARKIQVRTLGDPLPEELDNLLEKLDANPAARSAAASQIAKAKLRYLERNLKRSRINLATLNRMRSIFQSIDAEHVEPALYRTISKHLFKAR